MSSLSVKIDDIEIWYNKEALLLLVTVGNLERVQSEG
jgi:hypothetical protein